jgi:hypothetical protein
MKRKPPHHFGSHALHPSLRLQAQGLMASARLVSRRRFSNGTT